jgi:hypothetical protein
MNKNFVMSFDEPCIDANEMARLLGRAPSLIRRMARGHKIPAHVIRNGCRTYYSFRATEVFAALRNNYGKEMITVEAASDPLSRSATREMEHRTHGSARRSRALIRPRN